LDLKQIKQVIDLMKRSDLTEFSVEEEGFKLRIRRGPNGQPITLSRSASASPFPVAAEPAGGTNPPMPIPPAASALASPAASNADEPGISYIKSPMVGTFYRSPSPESPPFADVNTKFTETSLICIIEAMKIMNEIQAETKGTILEILVENGQPVEYGQRLFKIKTA
jgi:acetyl-CoA carboxylase biotin carboxyl carrier protein